MKADPFPGERERREDMVSDVEKVEETTEQAEAGTEQEEPKVTEGSLRPE